MLNWLRLLVLGVALAFGALPGRAADEKFAFRCNAKDLPSHYKDQKQTYHVWTARDVPETESTDARVILNVHFMDEDKADEKVMEKEKAMVREFVKIWETAAPGVAFSFNAPADESHVRIKFRSWYDGQDFKDVDSAVGNLALRVPRNRPTMLLPAGDSLQSWMIVHAFGHVLGLGHEHLDSTEFSGWRVSNVFRDYWNNDWCDKSGSLNDAIERCHQTIEWEITAKAASASAHRYACPGATAADPQSVMVAPIGEGWLGAGTRKAKAALSTGDQECVRQLYKDQQPQGGGRITASVFPYDFRQIYRHCVKDNTASCQRIDIVRNDGGRLEFELDEPGGRRLWAWERKDELSYELKSVFHVFSGRRVSRKSTLERRVGYYQGRIDGYPGCPGGNVYFMIGERCPDNKLVEAGLRP